MHTSVEPGENQLQSIPLFNLIHEFVDGEIACHRRQESFDGCFVAVDVKQSTDDLRSPDGIDALYIDFDELCEAILIEVKNEVVDEVETIADNDKGKLVLKLCLLQEIFDFLWIVMVALSADALNFTNLAGPSGCLNVLEVDLGIFAEVHD